MIISNAEYSGIQSFSPPREYVTAMSNHSPSAENELLQEARKVFLVLYGTEFVS